MIYRIPETVRRFPNPESFRGPGKRLGFSTDRFLFNPGNPVNPVKKSDSSSAPLLEFKIRLPSKAGRIR